MSMKMTMLGVSMLSLAAGAALGLVGCSAADTSSGGPEAQGGPSVKYESTNGGEPSLPPTVRFQGSTLQVEGVDKLTQIAPGVYETVAPGGESQRIVVGPEGHAWQAARIGEQLSELYGQAEKNPEVRALVASLTEQRDKVQALSAPSGASAFATCSVGYYIGPASVVTSYVGAAALAQLACTDGCQSFTVYSQACCAGTCTPVLGWSGTVCAPSVVRTGAIRIQNGGAGEGAVIAYPPGVGVSRSGFTCY